MVDWILIGVFAISSYLLGNVNWAIIISKFKKVDIRSMGSGNPGTLNMSRNLGLKAGLLTFFLDILKGVIPTIIAYFVFKDKLIYDSGFYLKDFAVYLCGFAVVIGHIYPVFMKFKGGKGIATSIGVFLTIEAVNGWGWVAVAVMAIVAAALFIYFTEFGAMGSFIATTPSAIVALNNVKCTVMSGYSWTTSIKTSPTLSVIFNSSLHSRIKACSFDSPCSTLPPTNSQRSARALFAGLWQTKNLSLSLSQISAATTSTITLTYFYYNITKFKIYSAVIIIFFRSCRI